mgnify:CR=1 FL=1
MKNMKHGLQLYNFRKELKEDFRGTLKKIAALGFDGVEFAVDYGKIPPVELAGFLQELGLECAGTMFSANDILNPASQVFEYAHALNSPAVTVSKMYDFVANCEPFCELCRKLGDTASANGSVFSYHNHWAEFALKDGVPVLDWMLQATDPEKVFLELDVCWLTRAGFKPGEYIPKCASRIRQLHVKDIIVPDDPNTTTELGTGVVDLKAAFLAAKQTPCQWMIYEQDNCKGSPFDSAKISLEFLKKLR